jgi:hypothetical protein
MTERAAASKTIPVSVSQAVAILVVLFIAYGVIVWSVFGDEKGVFGDMYGGLNALFSGAALLGVVVAILLQREELQLQRQELTETRIELAKSAAAQVELTRLQLAGLQAEALALAVSVLEGPYTAAKREGILRLPDDVDLGKAEISSLDRVSANEVCRTFEVVGVMVRHELVKPKMITDSYGFALRESWRKLRPYVERERQRKEPGVWRAYEELAAIAGARDARGPAETDAADE